MSVDTVFVIPYSITGYDVADIAAAIRWSCVGSHVVLTQTTPLPYCGLLPYSRYGFVCGQLLYEYIHAGNAFRQAIFLDRSCLITGKGLDAWVATQLQKRVDLLGVQDADNYADAFPQYADILAEWDLPYDNWDVVPQTVADPFIAISYQLAARLYQGNWLTPTDWDRWQMPYGVFLSWAAQMLGYYMVLWGRMDRHLPPLYVSKKWKQPPPHILHPSFLLYHSVRRVEAYSEDELRQVYKRLRGELAEPVEPLRPTVFGIGLGEQFTEAG